MCMFFLMQQGPRKKPRAKAKASKKKDTGRKKSAKDKKKKTEKKKKPSSRKGGRKKVDADVNDLGALASLMQDPVHEFTSLLVCGLWPSTCCLVLHTILPAGCRDDIFREYSD